MSTKGKTWKRKTTPSLEQFFNARVIKGDECWQWIGRVDSTGYGVIQQNQKQPRKLAHRLSWEIHKGAIPEGLFVCHVCDNPPCCNPNHLFLGTCTDNNRDAWKKGRMKPPDNSVMINRTHCSKGHLFDEKNSYYRPGTNHRTCRECHRLSEIERRARVKEL